MNTINNYKLNPPACLSDTARRAGIKKIMTILAVSLLTFALSLLPCFAQQTPQYTQFMLNNYGLNPAACGTSNNKLEALIGFRRQWVGFENMPVTSFFNFNTWFGSKTRFNRGWHGIGAYWQGDRQGNIIKSDDFYVSYTYLIRVNRKGYIAYGLAGGARRYSFSGVDNILDPVTASRNIWLYPDFIPGIKFWNSAWSFDLSVKQLYKYKVKQGGAQIGSPAKLPPHFYFSVTRKWWPLSYLLVIQSLHVKYNFASFPSIDYNLLAHLNKNFAVGLSYRHFDAIAAVLQVRFAKLVIGIAYDYTIAPYRIGFANSQEFMMGISPSPYYGSPPPGNQYKTAECPTFQY